MTLRVLHVDTERGWRGGQRQTLWLARELARRGHESIVAARRGDALSDRAAAAGLSVVECSPFSEIDVHAAWRLRRALGERRIDIVHAHSAHAVSLAALATLGTTIPFVASRRVDFPLRANAGTRWKYGRAAVIIAISQAVARVLTASGIAPDRVVVVPDGVDMDRVVSPATRDVLASVGLPVDAPVVVQVAQLVGHKDPVNFVRAMARVREIVPAANGLLVGDGPLRGEVEHEIRTLGLASSVHLAGYRTDADALLASATVACLSSREEGMGSVLLDALAFGVPIAATRAGGIAEVVVDGECGLLADVANPAALGDAIARILRDGDLRERLRAGAKPRAREFSVERMTDRTIAVYETVLASGDRRSPAARAKVSSSSSVTGAP